VPQKFLSIIVKFFWREAFQTATFLDRLTVIEIDNKKLTQFEHWENQLPRFVKNLREWGEAGIVKLRTSTTPKIYDRGKPCKFVGYCLNHAGDTSRMWDPDTKRVHLSRDIVWTGRMYFGGSQLSIEGPLIPNFHNPTLEVDKLDDDEDIDQNKVSHEPTNDSTTRSGRAI
jgi:hypothetical protein